MKKELKADVMIWDYKEQIDIDELNRILRGFGFPGAIRQVDTDSDSYALVITNNNASQDKAQEIFDKETDYEDDA